MNITTTTNSHRRHTMSNTITRTAAAIAAAAILTTALGACSATASPRTTAATTPAARTAPVTATAARTAAARYLALYAAGQYSASWSLLTPAAQKTVTRKVWTRAHQECPGAAAGLTYNVGKPVMAGKTAVMKVTLAGAASALGSEEITFTYSGGRWGYAPSDLSFYHGTTARAVAALKHAGYCNG